MSSDKATRHLYYVAPDFILERLRLPVYNPTPRLRINERQGQHNNSYLSPSQRVVVLALPYLAAQFISVALRPSELKSILFSH